MKHAVIQRSEMMSASLALGGRPLALSGYATTGLMGVAVGPRGHGKTNAGLLIAEQLSGQGWVSVLIDPEGELESMYGEATKNPEALRGHLTARDRAIVVVSAKDAGEFVPFGQVILECADAFRKPLYVLIDEGQLFSAAKKRKDGVGEATDIICQMAERGRKRALDMLVTTHRYTATVHRTLFANKNLTLVGCQEDPTAWSALAPMFRSSGIDFKDLNALGPAEFICFSRRGIEKIKLPMAEGLRKVASAAKTTRRMLPATFSQWDRAMRAIPRERLSALSDPVIELLSTVSGIPQQQRLAGVRALGDELEARV